MYCFGKDKELCKLRMYRVKKSVIPWVIRGVYAWVFCYWYQDISRLVMGIW